MINWRLKRLIVEKWGSQVDFSMRVGRSQSYVSEIILGRRHLSDEEKQTWAVALQIDESEMKSIMNTPSKL